MNAASNTAVNGQRRVWTVLRRPTASCRASSTPPSPSHDVAVALKRRPLLATALGAWLTALPSASRAEDSSIDQESLRNSTSPDVTHRVALNFALCVDGSRSRRTLVANFVQTVESGSYEGTLVNRIRKGSYLSVGKQGARRNGEVEAPTSLQSNPELTSAKAFALRHVRPGTVSLAIAENEDASERTLAPGYHPTQFLITTGPGPAPQLDNSNVVFGRVLDGFDTLAELSEARTYQPSTRIQAFNTFARAIGDERAMETDMILNDFHFLTPIVKRAVHHDTRFPKLKMTSCKLCVSRIKLNRNKREIQLTHQRREIGNLLKQGKNEYAWIRVEAVIREKNLLAAYEILELYLELIAVRVELLEKHRTCPKDMVEAITTLMYAAPRVADLPELVDVRKWLSMKFGRELGVEGGRNSDGTEPQTWQVNTRLRQYLAVEAPEAEDKLTMISQIAQEVGTEFDLESFAESVMVQLDPEVTGPPPPIPQRPVPEYFQARPSGPPGPPPPVQQHPPPEYFQARPPGPPGPPPPGESYPYPNYGAMPPTAVTPASPIVREPSGGAPVIPPKQPSFRVPYQGPSTVRSSFKRDVGWRSSEVVTGTPASPTAPPPPLPPPEAPRLTPEEEEYQRRQKQYDDVPGPPKKAFHEEEPEEETLPQPPSAPPPSDGIDSDLASRLDALRKR